jgi:mannose-6-phosphate isomerase-like protein (cupin superfamily)
MTETTPRRPLILGPGEGRRYPCGTMTAVFKADGDETESRYSVSEWWLEPQSDGPGAHLHEANDELFLSIEGRPSVLVGEDWHDLERGSLVIIPAGTMHDFQNRTAHRAGLFNVFIPGGFEANMPSIVDWFRANPPKRGGAATRLLNDPPLLTKRCQDGSATDMARGRLTRRDWP